MARGIDYGNLMHRAMRGLITEVLRDVEANGLPGEHHFFITFDTRHSGALLADWLRERYPEEMTVVMQHWFDGLKVDDEGFAVAWFSSRIRLNTPRPDLLSRLPVGSSASTSMGSLARARTMATRCC